MKKIKRIILHVGPHKTGTSTIQHFFYSNRNLYKEKENIVYLDVAKNHGGDIYKVFSEQIFDSQVKEDEQGKTRSSIVNRYKAELESASADVLIISGESISLLNDVGFKKLKAFLLDYTDRIDVVFFMRHPVEWVTSMIQQHVKRGDKSLKEMYLTPLFFDFKSIIKSLVSVFGNGNVIVSDFNKAIKTGNLVKFFCDVTSIAYIDLGQTSKLQVNPSLSQYATELLDALNQEGFGRYPGDLIPFRKIEGKKFGLTNSVRKQIYLDHERDINWLHDHYGISYEYECSKSKYDTNLCYNELLSVARVIHENYRVQRQTHSYSRAEMLYFSGSYIKARDILLRSEKQEDMNAHGYRLLAQVYMKLSSLENASRCIEKALTLSPQNKNFEALRKVINEKKV